VKKIFRPLIWSSSG